MKKHFALPSTDGSTNLHLILWQTVEKPKAVLQLVHGMAEFIDRYDRFATLLAEEGFLVIGHDHLGHGQSLTSEQPLYGYFSKKNSAELLINDTYTVTKWAKSHYSNIPYFIMGHSMGSFVLRNYLNRFGQEVDGSIIMGTGGQRKELALVLPLTKWLNRLQPKKINSTLDSLAFGNFAKSFPEHRSSFDWLSKNQTNVDNYIAHPELGFTFTNNGFDTLFTLMSLATSPGWYANIPTTLPLYIVSGEQDPVGAFGKGPRAVASELEAAGFSDITLHLYRELRHELLNETEHLLVTQDIIDWLNSHC